MAVERLDTRSICVPYIVLDDEATMKLGREGGVVPGLVIGVEGMRHVCGHDVTVAQNLGVGVAVEASGGNGLSDARHGFRQERGGGALGGHTPNLLTRPRTSEFTICEGYRDEALCRYRTIPSGIFPVLHITICI